MEPKRATFQQAIGWLHSDGRFISDNGRIDLQLHSDKDLRLFPKVRCACNKGLMSKWDGKCSYCRTPRQQENHQHALDRLPKGGGWSEQYVIGIYQNVRNEL